MSDNNNPDPKLNIVHEDDRLLVLNKPADLVCHPTKTDAWSSLIGRVRLHLGENATAHLLNRLDRETTGLVLVAKDDELARAIRKIWERRDIRKEYSAIVHGWPEADDAEIDGPLGNDESSVVAIKDCVRPDGAPSLTRFEVVRRFQRGEARFALLRVVPLTGRKHQIRIHLSHIGHAIVGDKLYGHDEDCYLALVERRLSDAQRKRLILGNHALHAGGLRFELGDEIFEFQAEPSVEFSGFLQK